MYDYLSAWMSTLFIDYESYRNYLAFPEKKIKTSKIFLKSILKNK